MNGLIARLQKASQPDRGASGVEAVFLILVVFALAIVVIFVASTASHDTPQPNPTTGAPLNLVTPTRTDGCGVNGHIGSGNICITPQSPAGKPTKTSTATDTACEADIRKLLNVYSRSYIIGNNVKPATCAGLTTEQYDTMVDNIANGG